MIYTTGRTHIILAAMLGAMATFKLGYLPPAILYCIVGGLFPDTDIKTSQMGRIIPMWLFFTPHRRNLLHSPLGAIVFTLPVLFISRSYSFIFFLGYASHLFLDLFNQTGIPLLYPYGKMYSLGSIKSESLGELLLAIGFYMMLVVIMSL